VRSASANLRPAHDLDVGLGHTPPVLVLDRDPGPITFAHAEFLLRLDYQVATPAMSGHLRGLEHVDGDCRLT